LSHTVHKYGLVLSSCGCSVISLLSASVISSVSYTMDLSPANMHSIREHLKKVKHKVDDMTAVVRIKE